jgi:hypothetical protein
MSTPTTLKVSFKRYAPFIGAKGHGNRMTFNIQVAAKDAAKAKKLFASRGALIASVR